MIRFENVYKEFGAKQVLKGFNLEIRQGETMSLVGTSGAGKSVTLKHMVALLNPTSGRILIGDDCISEAAGRELERIRTRFGYLFQGGALLQWMSVGENVALPLREHTRLTEEEIEARVMRVLEQVNLAEAVERLPANISGGMVKRAGLARAIVREPEIVLYDEPTSGLDPVTSRTIDELIMDLQRDIGMTSVVVTHDMISALTISNRIAMLHQGQVIEVSEPEAFLNSGNPIVRGFLDSQCISRNFFQEFPLRRITTS